MDRLRGVREDDGFVVDLLPPAIGVLHDVYGI